MNLSEFKIKSSRKDPEFSVYELKEKIVRALPSEAIDLLEGSTLEHFPTIKKLELINNNQYFEIEKFHFIVYPYELPFNLLKDSSLFYIATLNMLIDKGLSFKDATPFNICYMGEKQFKHFDLGSIQKYNPVKGWEGYRQFLAEFYFPIIYLKENKNIYPTDLVKLFFDKQWIYKHNFGWQNYLNPGFNIHYAFYKQSAVRKLGQKPKVNDAVITTRSVKSNLYLLQNHIKGLSIPKSKTKWDNYYSQTILKDGYVDKKIKLIKELLRTTNQEVAFATDWGANDGKFSKIILEIFKTSTVICVESDYNAVNQLYLNCKNERVIPVYTDVLNMSPSLGFDGERISLKERLKHVCDFQMCLGLIHHLIHQDNLCFADIISFFSEASKDTSYLLIEFISSDDLRHQLIKNPNYNYRLTRAYFVESLNNFYEILDSREVIPTRELFLCRKKYQKKD